MLINLPRRILVKKGYYSSIWLLKAKFWFFLINRVRSSGFLLSLRSFPEDRALEMTYGDLKREAEKMLKKPTKTSGGVGARVVVSDAVLEERCPTVLQYLQNDTYEDGSPRRTSTITLFVEDGRVKACLNDRDNDRTCFVTAESLLDVLDALEVSVLDEGTVWKEGRKPTPRTKKS